MIKNRLILIDAFALIHRAYHGIPPLTTKNGEMVNAVYGFSSALLSAIKDLRPEYLVVGVDLPKPTIRKQEYAEYKAHRKPLPDDFKSQIPFVYKVLEAFNIPVVGVEGYEGEDVLATIVAQVKSEKLTRLPARQEAQSDGIQSIIVTGDSDTFQLIDETTMVYSMARGVQHAVLYDTKKVIERYELVPAQIVDFKALKGDASDNIPGVPGIGEKTATNLVKKYKTLDNLYKEIAKILNCKVVEINDQIIDKNDKDLLKKMSELLKISEKVLRLLIDNREQAFLSQKLATICRDVPLEFKLESASIHDYDQQKIITLFEELGFKSLINRLPEVIKKEKPDLQQSLF